MFRCIPPYAIGYIAHENVKICIDQIRVCTNPRFSKSDEHADYCIVSKDNVVQIKPKNNRCIKLIALTGVVHPLLKLFNAKFPARFWFDVGNDMIAYCFATDNGDRLECHVVKKRGELTLSESDELKTIKSYTLLVFNEKLEPVSGITMNIEKVTYTTPSFNVGLPKDTCLVLPVDEFLQIATEVSNNDMFIGLYMEGHFDENIARLYAEVVGMLVVLARR